MDSGSGAEKCRKEKENGRVTIASNELVKSKKTVRVNLHRFSFYKYKFSIKTQKLLIFSPFYPDPPAGGRGAKYQKFRQVPFRGFRGQIKFAILFIPTIVHYHLQLPQSIKDLHRLISKDK